MADSRRMTYRSNDRVSRNLMRGVLVLLVTVLALVGYARLTDRPLEARPPAAPILVERVLFIEGNIAGEARVTDADGAVVAEYGRGEAVFISTIDRALRRERQRHEADAAAPYHLRLRAGGRLSIYDPATGGETELEGFGDDNIAAFRALLGG